MATQSIKYYDKPAPHIIIDNFLSNKLANKFIEEATELKPKFEGAMVSGEDSMFDDCPACQQQKKILRNVTRQNDVAYLENLDSTFIKEALLEATVHSDSFMETMRGMPSMFPIILNTDKTEQILSRYGTCDFYGWHYDNLGHKGLQKARVLTLIYYFNTEPQKFEGGELMISYPTIKDTKKIKPKHNRLLMFLSHTMHSVSSVKLNSPDFKDGRFSINFWVGFQ